MLTEITNNATVNTEPPVSRLLLQRIGAEIYAEHRPESDCLTVDERIGWWTALNAEVETGMIGYAERHGF